jgi:hypothetical protein
MQQPKVTEVHRLSPYAALVVSTPSASAQQAPAQGQPRR